MTDGLVVAVNFILTLNPKPSTVVATERKVNSIPSKTRTFSEAPAHGEYKVPLTGCRDPWVSPVLVLPQWKRLRAEL